MIAYFTYTISSHHNNTGFEKKYWLYCTITVHTNALITSLNMPVQWFSNTEFRLKITFWPEKITDSEVK